jgi:hypothetical protein
MKLALTRRIAGALLFAVGGLALGGGAARAADGVAAQIETHNKNFLAAYEKGATAKMKTEIGKSVALGEKNGLADKPDAKPDDKALMADTYVLAAILEVDGNENRAAGVRDFVKALKLKPDVAIPQGMATSPVKAALKEARAQAGTTPKEAAAPVSAGDPKAATKAKGDDQGDDKKTDKADADKQAATDKKAFDKEAEADKKTVDKKADADKKAVDKKADADKQAADKQAEADKKAADKRADADKQAADKRAATDKQAADKQAEADKKAVDKRADADKQAADKQAREAKAERDKQLAEVAKRTTQLEKDKADRDKQLADAKARAAQLEADKADRDKQIAELKSRVHLLEQQRDDREKVITEARAQAAKEREGREKIEHERQAVAAKVQAAEDKRKHDQQERDRLLAGPELPARLPEALTCAIPDEAPAHADLYVHCAARANVKARTIVFYYRVGGAHYTSVTMDRTPKGWYAAVVPAAHVVGKSLQYYAQAFDAHEKVAAANGKESSPNILMVRGAPRG